MKEKPVSFKMENKEIARRKIIELEIEIKVGTIIKTRKSKIEILREVIEEMSRELNTERKLKKQRNELRSFVVYKFTCAGCQSCYIGKTTRHLAATVKDHLVTDKKSHIMKQLLENKTCKSLCDEVCFQVIDYASTTFRLKVKEA